MLLGTLLSECLSLMMLAIIFTRYYCYEEHRVLSFQSKIFLGCLFAAAGSILLNIITVSLPYAPTPAPFWLEMLLNSGYFVAIGFTCTLFALFMFVLTLEHVYDKHCLKNACVMLTVVLTVYLLLVAVNPFTGILFYFDEAQVYCQGPLNRCVFLMPVIELGFLIVCYIRNNSSVGRPMKYVMMVMPPIVLLLCLASVIFPNLLLNGILSSFVCLVLFLSFQTNTGDRDTLTSVRSRHSFISELSLRLKSSQPVHIISVSLQSFSDINLEYDHKVGDALLYEIARYLDELYSDGRAFRTSNTTFTLVLPWVSEEVARSRLLTIQDRLQSPWTLGKLNLLPLSCIADYCLTDLSISAEEVMDHLTYLVSVAKKQGGIVRYSESISREMQEQKELDALIRWAIQERQFRVWYQPVYCCHKDEFCSAEALLRLNDENGKPVSPEKFISAAENNGMIGDLTWIVLDNVCQLLSSNAALPSVSLNLSMQQLSDPELAQKFKSYLELYHVSPSRLKVEITERLLLKDAQFARQQLLALSSLGIQIYMDDFGTGYSNLSSVLNYPFTSIKLDRSLIRNIPQDDQADLMVRTMLMMFHHLEKTVVVEGVEHQETAQYLKSCGADMIQGFYYAKPMPQDDLIQFFAATPE